MISGTGESVNASQDDHLRAEAGRSELSGEEVLVEAEKDSDQYSDWKQAVSFFSDR